MVNNAIYQQKRVMREERRGAAAVRRGAAAVSLGEDGGDGESLRNLFMRDVRIPLGCLVATTIPQKGEINPGPLGVALLAGGHRLCLPCVVGKKLPLVFRAWTPGDPLVPGMWGIPEPLETVPVVEPDVLLVPLVAFDKYLNRLGQGAGCYDRTLAKLRAQRKILAVGLAFSSQEVPLVPFGPEDQQLNLIVTEQRVFAGALTLLP